MLAAASMSDLTLDLAADAVLLQLFFLPVPVLLAARGQQLLLDLDTAVQGFGRCALPRAAPTSGAERATGLWLRRA